MNDSKSHLSLLLGSLALVAAVVGARWFLAATERPLTAPVSGTIRYKGVGFADADVAFIAEGAPRYGIARTDAEGRFILGTFQPGDGALVGRHRVTVSTSRGLPPPPDASNLDTKEKFDAYKAWLAACEAAVRAGKSGLPRRYAAQSTTPLEVTVGPEGGIFDLELQDE